MADGIQVKVDATRAIARFSPAGIPEAVRRNLRSMIPDLTKRLGSLVDAKLNSDLKSRKRLEVKKEMVENPREIYGRVRLISTSEPKLLPDWLEHGTRPHLIEAKAASALSFFWERVGAHVFYKSVHHPGTKAYAFMERSFDEMRTEIVRDVELAVKDGAKQA